jgi:L-amino acid N-acyltransferase YncA
MQSPRFSLDGCSFRLLVEEDSLELLEWRNNPDVYRFTRSGSPIGLEAHSKWMASRLEKLETDPIYILEKDVNLGMFRVDTSNEEKLAREISILVSANNLGVGIGSQMINLYLNSLPKNNYYEHFARVHQKNEKSLSFFSKHNFVHCRDENEFVLLKLLSLNE